LQKGRGKRQVDFPGLIEKKGPMLLSPKKKNKTGLEKGESAIHSKRGEKGKNQTKTPRKRNSSENFPTVLWFTKKKKGGLTSNIEKNAPEEKKKQ